MSEAYRFQIEDFLPRRILDAVTDVRVECPDAILAEAESRRRRTSLTRNGKLAILAADHPARGVTGVGDHPLLMGNRQEYLGRVLRIITDPQFDGIMGPPALIEDIFIINYLVKQGGGPSLLDDKVMVGCMQRGGAAGVVGELNDRFTAFTARSLAELRMEGGKMMFRWVPEDERTLDTLAYCATAVTELNAYGLVPFIEPLPQKQQNIGTYSGDSSMPVLVKTVSIAQSLGDFSRYTWLKVSYTPGFDEVAAATTLPILMLGGPAKGDIRPLLTEFADGMKAGGNVRGAMVGRNCLFPGDEDPLAAAAAVIDVIHHGRSADQAAARIDEYRGQNLDILTRYI